MSKRTEALKIPMRVKQLVWMRQGGVSLWSFTPITVEECCCHVVPRSKGGLGVEENIVGLTTYEHRIFDLNELGDHKKEHDAMRQAVKDHLMKFYPGWNEDDLKYKK